MVKANLAKSRKVGGVASAPNVLSMLRSVSLITALVLVWLGTSWDALADWSLRRDHRVIESRLLQTLSKDPFHTEAWYHLLRLRPLPQSTPALHKLFERRIKLARRPTTSRPWRILQARLWLETSAWGEAYSALSLLDKEASLGGVGLRWRLRCLAALGEIRKTLEILRQEPSDLPPKQRLSFAFEYLRVALHLRDHDEIPLALQRLTPLALSSQDQAKIAFLLHDGKRLKSAPIWIERALPSAPPPLRFSLLLRLAAIVLERLETSFPLPLSTSSPSPSPPGLPPSQASLHESLLSRLSSLLPDLRSLRRSPLLRLSLSPERLRRYAEIEIRYHRRLRSLPTLLKIATHPETPASIPEIRRWLPLAQELQDRPAILDLAHRLLRLAPYDLEAQTAILHTTLQIGQIDAAERLLQRLWSQKQATPAHLLLFAHAWLRLSNLPPLEPWRGYWGRQSHVLPCPLGAPWGSLAILSSRKPTIECFRVSRSTWEEYRTRRWAFWERYEASPLQKQALQKAHHALLLGLQRFRSPSFLLEAERLLESHAGREDASRIRTLLIQSLRWHFPLDRFLQEIHLRADLATWDAIWATLLRQPLTDSKLASPWLLAYDDLLRFHASLPTSVFLPFLPSPRSPRVFAAACQSLRPLLASLAAKLPSPPPSSSVLAALQQRCLPSP